MENTIVQAALWIGAGCLLVMFLMRRRKRRLER